MEGLDGEPASMVATSRRAIQMIPHSAAAKVGIARVSTWSATQSSIPIAHYVGHSALANNAPLVHTCERG